MNIDDVVLNFSPGSLVALNIVLGLIMFGIAIDTSIEDFKAVRRAPRAFLIALVAQIFPFSSPMAMAARAANSASLWPHALAVLWQLLQHPGQTHPGEP